MTDTEQTNTDIPNWLQAPPDLKKQSYDVMNQESTKLGRAPDSREHIDWDKVNEVVIDWWAEKGYSYP